jgi:hypothetical protein
MKFFPFTNFRQCLHQLQAMPSPRVKAKWDFRMWGENQLQFRFGPMAIPKIGKIRNFQNGHCGDGSTGQPNAQNFQNGHIWWRQMPFEVQPNAVPIRIPAIRKLG